tara:strand:- start:1038 stop:1475 length:438 start_codon:yes stop_codon:yes gene_type:complete
MVNSRSYKSPRRGNRSVKRSSKLAKRSNRNVKRSSKSAKRGNRSVKRSNKSSSKSTRSRRGKGNRNVKRSSKSARSRRGNKNVKRRRNMKGGFTVLPSEYFGRGSNGYHPVGSSQLKGCARQVARSQGVIHDNGLYAGPALYPKL